MILPPPQYLNSITDAHPTQRAAMSASLARLSRTRGALPPLSSLRLPLSTQPRASPPSPAPSSSATRRRVPHLLSFLAAAVASVGTTVALCDSGIDRHRFAPPLDPSPDATGFRYLLNAKIRGRALVRAGPAARTAPSWS
jgi:hypothetical protein